MSSTSFLESLLQLSDAQLQHSITLPQVHSVLVSLLSSPSSDRELLHFVISRLSLLPNTLDLSLLISYIKTYYPTNKRLVEKVLDDAFSSSISLKQLYSRLIPTTLEQELVHSHTSEPNYSSLETLLILQLAAHRHFPSPSPTSSSTYLSILSQLSSLYSTLSLSLENDSTHDQLLLLILSSTHSLLTLPTYSLEQLDETLEKSLSTSLNEPALLRDVEVYFRVSKELGERVQGQVGTVAREVKDSIGKIKKLGGRRDSQPSDDPKGKGKESIDWIERIQRRSKLGGNAQENIDETSLKTNEIDDQEEDVEMVSTISTIQELFPHLSDAFLRKALRHPKYRGLASRDGKGLGQVSERLVASLLEDDLPNDLKRSLENGGQEEEEETEVVQEEEKKVEKVERRNVFDEDKNFSKGTLVVPGSKQSRTFANGGGGGGKEISLDERLKESIIALANRPDTDSEDDEFDQDAEAFLDDENNEDRGRRRAKIGLRDNGAEDEEDEEEDEEEELMSSRGQSGTQTPVNSKPSNLFNPSTIQLLERTYLSSPQSFSSDSSTRRTNPIRLKLKRDTGLDDSQIEGWKVNLERTKGGVEKVRERIMDLNARGNHPVPSNENDSQGASRGRGEGGGGGGRGRGGARGGGNGGGRGGANRGKGDGGRAQHDRRKRGNDKKMQKMGATL
ncbi:hypothetical protein JCM16303_005952 [Sporobolomyces ruberrimus]